jgi:hypothetical protein
VQQKAAAGLSGKLLAIRVRAADLLLENLGAAGGLQLGNLVLASLKIRLARPIGLRSPTCVRKYCPNRNAANQAIHSSR